MLLINSYWTFKILDFYFLWGKEGIDFDPKIRHRFFMGLLGHKNIFLEKGGEIRNEIFIFHITQQQGFSETEPQA